MGGRGEEVVISISTCSLSTSHCISGYARSVLIISKIDQCWERRGHPFPFPVVSVLKTVQYLLESEVAQLCLTLCDPMTRLLHPWDFPGKSTGVGCHFLLQGIFPTQGLNPGLPHCRQTLYPLSHQGSPSILIRLSYH